MEETDGEGEDGSGREAKEASEEDFGGDRGRDDEDIEEQRGGDREDGETELGARRASELAVYGESNMARRGADERSDGECAPVQPGASPVAGEKRGDRIGVAGENRSGGGGGRVVLRKQRRRGRSGIVGEEDEERAEGDFGGGQTVQELLERGVVRVAVAMQAPVSVHCLWVISPHLSNLQLHQ